ncbi:hypothetical protein EVAR_41245_1 [Eumeta japonica]|uniref:Uncharacterized protein n=1 Tax=Eumeta variegata TaxID=151549 RepID=A0A4C1W4L6_EUMVA|nr:hypothetical protein EVAR_41245_1 [Eumeta japonica]
MYFDMAIKPDLLLDDSHSFNNPSLSEVDSYYPDPSTNLIKENDSGMSSEDNDGLCDIMNTKVNSVHLNGDLTSSLRSNSEDLITKCLNQKPQCAPKWNEIPCCSTDFSLSVKSNERKPKTDLSNENSEAEDNKISDFVIIDLASTVDDPASAKEEERTVNICDGDDCESVDASKALVPVKHNELVTSESQKLPVGCEGFVKRPEGTGSQWREGHEPFQKPCARSACRRCNKPERITGMNAKGITVAVRCTLRSTTHSCTRGARHSGMRLEGTLHTVIHYTKRWSMGLDRRRPILTAEQPVNLQEHADSHIHQGVRSIKITNRCIPSHLA